MCSGVVRKRVTFMGPLQRAHDYYPRTGGPTEPFGITMTDGVEFGANRFHRGTV